MKRFIVFHSARVSGAIFKTICSPQQQLVPISNASSTFLHSTRIAKAALLLDLPHVSHSDLSDDTTLSNNS